jgi:hypothetical protein
VSSYPKRSSSGSAAVGQGTLKDGRELDVTSFIGGESYNHWSRRILTIIYIFTELVPPEGDIAPPRRPWLPKPSDRFSTDSQDLSAAEIIKARSTTLTPAVRVAASQAVYFSPSTLATRQPGIRPSRPTSRPPFLSIMQQTGTGLPSGIAPLRPNRMKPLPLPNVSTNAPQGANRVPQGRPRRGALVAPQTSRPLSRQVSNPSTAGTSITLQGQQSTPVTTASTMASVPGVARAASKGKGKEKEKADLRPETPPALPSLPPLPALPAQPALPAPVGIARILAEMTDEVENGERVQETRKLRPPPFPAKRSGSSTRPQRF